VTLVPFSVINIHIIMGCFESNALNTVLGRAQFID
jgi:hypothetical protein